MLEAVRWAWGIEEVHRRIGARFYRSEPRRRALDYLKGLICPVERKHGWQLAEQAGDATPDGVQRLLYNYMWDADLVRDDLRDYAVEHLGDANGVLVVDETGFLKGGIPEEGNQVGGGATSVQWDCGSNRELPGRRIPDLCYRPGEGPAGSGVVLAPGMVGGLGAAP